MVGQRRKRKADVAISLGVALAFGILLGWGLDATSSRVGKVAAVAGAIAGGVATYRMLRLVERRRLHRQSTIHSLKYQIAARLAPCRSAADIGACVLDLLCREGGWTGGAVWLVQSPPLVLRRISRRAGSALSLAADQDLGFSFAEATARAEEAILVGEGELLGTKEIEQGIRSIAAFPITEGVACTGAVCLFSDSPLEPDPDWTPLFTIIGNQAGHYIAQHRAEEIREVSERRFRTIFSQAPIGIAIGDLEGRFIDVNSAFSRMLGYAEGELGGRSYQEVTHRDDVDSHLKILGRLSEVDAPPYENDTRYLNRDGKTVWAHVKVTLIRGANGNPHFVIVHAQDTTDRKKTEEQLRWSKDFAASTLESLTSSALVLDRFGVIVAVNEAWKKLAASLQIGERVKVGENYLHFLQSAKRWSPHYEAILGVLESQRATSSSAEAVFQQRVDGTPRWFLIRAVPLEHDAGGAVVSFMDVTTLRAAEEALRRGEMMANLGSLVAAVAHEVRNPLFGLSAIVDAFEARFGQSGEHEQYLKALRSELNRMNDLMRELLDYGKPVELKLEENSLDEVLMEAVRVCSPLAKSQSVTIEMQMKCPGVSLSIDRRRIVLAFRNLVENSIQHSPVGSRVLVESAELRDHSGVWAAVNVKDTGPGFSASDLPRVFEPFFSRRKGGTGLGLAIVKRIVDEHGGTLQAANRPEGGAVVTLQLPVNAVLSSSPQKKKAVSGAR